jgi:hypothetical protein
MPIEIRELYIRAVIDSGGGKPASEGEAGGQPQGGAPQAGTDQLIDLCVEKVMEILKEKNER